MYYQAFCSRVSRAYDDIVPCAFSSSHSLIPSDVETPLYSRERASQVITPDSDFLFLARTISTQMMLVISKKGNLQGSHA
jgi:hypothetical protein